MLDCLLRVDEDSGLLRTKPESRSDDAVETSSSDLFTRRHEVGVSFEGLKRAEEREEGRGATWLSEGFF